MLETSIVVKGTVKLNFWIFIYYLYEYFGIFWDSHCLQKTCKWPEIRNNIFCSRIQIEGQIFGVSKKVAPFTENWVPPLGNRSPHSGHWVPQFGNRVPHYENRLPHSENRVPHLGNQVPVSGDRRWPFFPISCENFVSPTFDIRHIKIEKITSLSLK